jgi:hypothetical protein
MTKISKLLLEDYIRYDNYIARSVDTNAAEGKGAAFLWGAVIHLEDKKLQHNLRNKQFK